MLLNILFKCLWQLSSNFIEKIKVSSLISPEIQESFLTKTLGFWHYWYPRENQDRMENLLEIVWWVVSALSKIQKPWAARRADFNSFKKIHLFVFHKNSSVSFRARFQIINFVLFLCWFSSKLRMFYITVCIHCNTRKLMTQITSTS